MTFLSLLTYSYVTRFCSHICCVLKLRVNNSCSVLSFRCDSSYTAGIGNKLTGRVTRASKLLKPVSTSGRVAGLQYGLCVTKVAIKNRFPENDRMIRH